MHCNAGQLSCPQGSETSTGVNSLNVPEDSTKNELVFGCGDCMMQH